MHIYIILLRFLLRHTYTHGYTCTFHPGNRIINHCGHMHTHTHTQRSFTTTWSGRRKHTSIWLYMHLLERHMHTQTRRGWHDVFRSTPSLRSVVDPGHHNHTSHQTFPFLEFVNSREWCIQTFWTFIFFACVRILNFLFSLLFLLLFSFLALHLWEAMLTRHLSCSHIFTYIRHVCVHQTDGLCDTVMY